MSDTRLRLTQWPTRQRDQPGFICSAIRFTRSRWQGLGPSGGCRGFPGLGRIPPARSNITIHAHG